MSQSYVFETEYQITYKTSEPVPIPEIIDSLKSLERLIKRTPPFLERHYKHIKITDTKVFVETIESGSLREKLKIQYFFGTEENYEDAKALAAKIMQDSTMVQTIVAFGIGALVTYGALQLVEGKTSTTHIEAHNNNIINVGGTADFSADDISAVLKAVKDKKQLAKDAVDYVKPAKNDKSASIEVEGFTGLKMEPDTISEVPYEYEVPQPTEKTSRYQNVDVFVVAMDRDSYEQGWAGTVPGIVETRTKFILNDAVDPAKVYGRKNLKADVSITERYQAAKKKYVPKLVEIELVN